MSLGLSAIFLPFPFCLLPFAFHSGTAFLRVEERQSLESLSQNPIGRQSEPLIEQGGVDAAEVDRPLQVAVDQLAESGRLTDETGPDLRPRDEYRARRAVIGAERTIFSGPPPEFAEGQQQDAVGLLRRRQVIQECADGPGEIAE